jgi:hypothetical protein
LLGSAIGVSIDDNVDETLLQESSEMQELCKDMNTIDNDSLLEVEEEETRYHKNVKSGYRSHFSKTKKQINSENHHILSTQKKCLSFVKKYRGHMKVCNWCKMARSPRIIWKWSPTEKVWYRWYDGKWHYWGESKAGFTKGGWTWWQGYWHHKGYVFKYVGKWWYRFQGGRWVRFGRKVPVSPKPPVGKPICRPFYRLERWGFPTSLTITKLPRCQVGRGKKASIYIWKNRSACRFLGGKLVYHRIHRCKAGKPHSWKRVIKCVRGPTLHNKGFNYKTGIAKKGTKIQK